MHVGGPFLLQPKLHIGGFINLLASSQVVECVQRFAARPKRRNAEHNDQEGGH